MSTALRTALTLVALAILAATLVHAQTKQTAADAAAVLAQRVEARRAFLRAQELRRIEIAGDLEFSSRAAPRPFPPPPPVCVIPPPTAPASIDPHRSLFVHDKETLRHPQVDFSLQRTLQRIANQVAIHVPGTTAASIFRQLWDTQNDAQFAVVATSPHCSDNQKTLNGYPIQCPRDEKSEVDAPMSDYPVLALVNRLDLAHQGWRNCGEFRIIYGKGGGGFRKNYIIFEAVLPNPKPGCRSGCVPVAEFWKSLSAVNEPLTRAQMLETFYYDGLPGFRPVVHVDHYSSTGVTGGYGSSGTGQIRTNQFLQSSTSTQMPWTLKEFKTVIDCASTCTFNLVPTMVKVNPFPELWDDDSSHLNGVDFRADVIVQHGQLASGDLMQIGYAVDLAHDDGESVSQTQDDNYRDQLSYGTGVFEAALAGTLTAEQIANRAMTQSCHGCHQPQALGLVAGGSIGPVTTPLGPVITYWPDSLSFVHVDTAESSLLELGNTNAFPTSYGHALSPALHDHFLPARLSFLVGQLDAPRCTCPRRFRFLPAERRGQAFEIERKVNGQFAGRLAEIEQRSAQRDPKMRAELLAAYDRIVAERDRMLATELAKAGIQLPDGEMLDLRATSVHLNASAAERTKAVNEQLKKEPPRRTVTGSFRSH